MRPVALVMMLLLGGSARAEPPTPTSGKVTSAILTGVAGLTAAGAYTAGAFLTGDQPGGRALAISGGAVSLGLTGVSLALAVNARRTEPGSMARFILVPLLSGLAGAVLGGLAAGFAAWQPGTARTATHGTVIAVFVGLTIVSEVAGLL